MRAAVRHHALVGIFKRSVSLRRPMIDWKHTRGLIGNCDVARQSSDWFPAAAQCCSARRRSVPAARTACRCGAAIWMARSICCIGEKFSSRMSGSSSRSISAPAGTYLSFQRRPKLFSGSRHERSCDNAVSLATSTHASALLARPCSIRTIR